jgi:kumamolisin
LSQNGVRPRLCDTRALTAAGLVAVMILGLLVADWRNRHVHDLISGPYAWLLASSVDLGPARHSEIELTVALHAPSRPVELARWAKQRGLLLIWNSGEAWASLEGPPDAIREAFDIEVHDYRGRLGNLFYASPQQPAIPEALRGEVSGLGRILSYTPIRQSRPEIPPRDVPEHGLTPKPLLKTYEADRLAQEGFTGEGMTVVVFAFDGFDQADLDMFSAKFGLPAFTPEVVGGMPDARNGEATMDLETIHAVAPGARKVLVNARPTTEDGGPYQRIARMLQDTDRRYPGAVWSFSIGWGCDKLVTAADLAPVRGALVAAQRHGTAAFDASGDLAGLECKGGQAWSTPPGPDQIGLDAVASLPEMTNVGGTTLSTDPSGSWLSEQAWYDPPLSLGTGGGESALYDRPSWQSKVSRLGTGRRQTPDVAALADPFTGLKVVFNQQLAIGGGTSLSAPIWAGFAAIINQYLLARGGRLLGDLNPQLYLLATGTPRPAFRDVVLGGNAVSTAHAGYDQVTGLGTPDVDNLARELLVAANLLR